MILQSEAAIRDIKKKYVLKALQNSEAWSMQLYLKKALLQMLSCEFREIFKNIF